MKVNLPVTGCERTFSESETLLSVTDERSCITYANDAFLRISGFERHELIGQFHHIVRHPDMPAQAFADMWATLQRGEAWCGLVKNRCKNGDHYWVRANVTPVHRDGRLVGYLSVRTAPRRADVQQAERLYAQARASGHLNIRNGVVAPHGVWAAWTLRRSAWPLWGTQALMSALPAAGLLLAWGAGAGKPAQLTGLAAGMSLALWLGHQRITLRLRQVLSRAQAVAAGQPQPLADASRTDEIGLLQRAIDQSGLNLRAVLVDVAEQAQGVASVSEQMAANNQDLFNRTEHTSSSLAQTANCMQLLGDTVRQTAGAAGQANGLVDQTCQAASQGGTAMAHIVQTMTDITASASRIGDIIGVIDGLAFQTNILALNASVESARAGVHGQGFAVVAAEVRQLAQRSATAAQEIRNIILSSREQIAAGGDQVRDAGSMMGGVVNQVHDVSGLIHGISQAATRQAQEIEQLVRTFAELDRLTQQNATMVEELSAAAQSLRGRSQRLVDVVSLFRS